MASPGLERLMDILEGLGVELRAERLGGDGGGLCVMRGRRVFFCDLDADDTTQEAVAIRALAELPGTDRLYLPPAVRERLESVRRERAE